MKLYKEYIRHCLLFCFHKKSAAAARRIIYVWWKCYSH